MTGTRTIQAGLTIAGLALIGLMFGAALTADDAPPAQVTVNCGNESANDGPNNPERDITEQEWEEFC